MKKLISELHRFRSLSAHNQKIFSEFQQLISEYSPKLHWHHPASSGIIPHPASSGITRHHPASGNILIHPASSDII